LQHGLPCQFTCWCRCWLE